MLNLTKYYYALSSFFFGRRKVDKLNEENIEFYKKSNKLPVILLHGSSTDYKGMYSTLRIFEKNNILPIALDYDSKDPIEKSAKKLKNNLEKILKVTNKKKADLIGICLGGLVARYYLEILNEKSKTDKFISVYTPIKPIPKNDSGYFLSKITGGRPDLYNKAMKKLGNKQDFKNYLRIVSEVDKIIKSSYSIIPGDNNLILNEGHLFVSFNPRIIKKVAELLKKKNLK